MSITTEPIPRPPADLPKEIRDELVGLEAMSDEELLRVARMTLGPGDVPSSYRPGDITDQLALRKAYALLLLKWRGMSLDEIEALMG